MIVSASVSDGDVPPSAIDAPAPSVGMRAYFSSYHLHAARDFSRRAAEIENRHSGGARFDIEHRSFVAGSIICAVAFLEAAVNELFQDVADSHLAYIDSFRAKQRAGLAKIWRKTQGRDMSVLDKYQSALTAVGARQFAKGRQPFQDVRLAVILRNDLVHYRPQTMRSGDVHRVQHQLAMKFAPCKLMTGSGNPWYPDHCLGAGAATWSLGTAKTFADEFFARLGVVPNYQRVSF